MYPEAGGSSSFARHAFNELVSFFAGWALTLDYIITIAISAFFVPHYLGAFFPALRHNPGDIIGGIVDDRAARGAEHPRAQGVGPAQPRPRAGRPRDAGRADCHRRLPCTRPTIARSPGSSRHGADLQPVDLRAVAGDGRLHRDRDGLEHGRGVAEPGARCAASRQLGADCRAGRLRGDQRRRAERAAGRSRRARLPHAAGDEVRGRPGARNRQLARHPRGRADRDALLRRDSRRDDPVHCDERRADRDLAIVVVARRAPPAPARVLGAAPDATARRRSRSSSTRSSRRSS